MIGPPKWCGSADRRGEKHATQTGFIILGGVPVTLLKRPQRRVIMVDQLVKVVHGVVGNGSRLSDRSKVGCFDGGKYRHRHHIRMGDGRP